MGDTPSTWSIKRLGYFFDERREKVSVQDFQPLSVTKRGIVLQLETAAKSDDGDNRKKVCGGDFVINSRSDRKGSSGASSLSGSVSLINTVIIPKRDIDIKFAHYLFRSTSFQEEYYRYGKGIVADLWSTNYSEMKNISIPVPSLIEQNKISDYLDHETAKIDRLVAEQEKLIELLKEKRQAVVSQAVTKGLDPNVKMKDSGVEWLGEVPEHWEVKRLKNEALVIMGQSPSSESYNVDGIGQPFLQGNADFGELNPTPRSYSTEVNKSATEGDLLLSVRAPVGALNIANQAYGIGRGLCAIRPNERVTQKFLFHSLELIKLELFSIATGSTYEAVTVEQVNNSVCLVPPLIEQNKISDYLDHETAKLESLIKEATSGIALLHERRSVLISDAVTGQIDLRNYQAKEAA
ncbi:MAG: restriction endonuclease subunit S [Gammaproteobacteria bacterium]|nr:restriction endonuclease subunit S [Gammaproteobacteria bacterium]